MLRGVRRSTRKTCQPSNYEELGDGGHFVQPAEYVEEVQYLPEDFDDSTVFKYSCATMPEKLSEEIASIEGVANSSSHSFASQACLGDKDSEARGDLRGFSLLSAQRRHPGDADTIRRHRGLQYCHSLAVPVSDCKRLYVYPSALRAREPFNSAEDVPCQL